MSGSHGHDQPLPEPSTPMWLPALGAVLFLLAAIAWTMSPSTPTSGAETTSAAAMASAAATPPPAPTGSGGPGGVIAKPLRAPRQPSPH